MFQGERTMKAKSKEKNSQFPNIMVLAAALLFGTLLRNFIETFDVTLFIDLIGLSVLLGLPYSILLWGDPANRRAMRETEILIHGLEEPFLREKPRPCSARDVRS